MIKKNFLPRALALTAGCSVLLGVGAAAIADTVEHGTNEIEVNVDIVELDEPGVLAMTVAGAGSMTLEENGSDEMIRQFTGTLPTVTVTDTRSAQDIADGAYWHVLGSASSFTSTGGDTIGAEHLGWTPNLVDGGESGAVTEGEQVDTAVDPGPDNVGLVDQELLAMAWDSAEVLDEGTWTANAELFLRTPVSVEPGSYSSKLTLSLFE
ncbi:hypothetical protein OK351_05560 [Glutamicibacter sp. MNS18]|uniref:hypothetical protein n=1 Tax=Glutamicibacter sp. MNS18 TaxID=2989817 RepID=UPI002236273D|nr:hypothetical protein [Glutamicibacter sp. MNS18]MCW4464968.1 hypothetical protein [Glutamicibacter sp. MNS18]